MIETMVEYKDRIAEAMEDAGLDVAELARRLQVSYQAVKKVVDGASAGFKVVNHFTACDLLGISPRWAATGHGSKHGTEELIKLEDALPVVLDAFGHLTPQRWKMICARLDDMPGHPEMRDDVISDILPLLTLPAARSGNPQAA